MRGKFSSRPNLLFDLDGTLVDSSGAHTKAYREALQPRHAKMARDFDYETIAGQPTREVFARFGIAGAELDALTLAKQQGYRAALERGEVALFSGAFAVLQKLFAAQRRLFLVTSASRTSAERMLTRAGIGKFFAGMIAAEDCASGKPSPEPYRTALKLWALEPAASVAIEDGESGWQSAQAAGLDVIALHTTSVKHEPSAQDFVELERMLLP